MVEEEALTKECHFFTKNKAKFQKQAALKTLLTSRRSEELSSKDSLMKSSSVLGWLVLAGFASEIPAPCCLFWSFWRRRSFLKSLAFLQGGRLGSAPNPVPEEEEWLSKQNYSMRLELELVLWTGSDDFPDQPVGQENRPTGHCDNWPTTDIGVEVGTEGGKGFASYRFFVFLN